MTDALLSGSLSNRIVSPVTAAVPQTRYSGGVTIKGTLVRINSGGSAGKGSGAKPELPAKAELAVVDEPQRPKLIDLRSDGIGQ